MKKLAIMLIPLLVFALVTSAVGCSSGTEANPTQSPAPPHTVTPTLIPTPKLEVLSWSWHREYGFLIAEGEIENISTEKLDDVTAEVCYYTDDHTFVKSDDALIDYNPVMPGQTSPFTVHTTDNPLICLGTLSFKHLLGQSIMTSYPSKAPAPTLIPTHSPIYTPKPSISGPCSFHGTVQINGANVADGTIIMATIDGDEYITITPAVYGPSTYAIKIVPAADVAYAEGAAITFMVDEYTADQMGTWILGGNIVLNLTAL